MMARPKTDLDDLPDGSKLGPPIAYSPEIAVTGSDPLLYRLRKIHGADVRRERDDLTAPIAAHEERHHAKSKDGN